MSRPPISAPGDVARPGKVALIVRAAVVVVALALFPVSVGMPGFSPGGHPTPPPATPAPVESPHEWPADATYDAVFAGDPTGQSDVGAALAAFLSGHSGKHVALARDAVYRVSQVAFTGTSLTVDFRGARLEASQRGVYGILVLRGSSDVVLNDPFVIGTGYEWTGGDTNPEQWEHGIEIDGGARITINHPRTRDVRGDGIYIGFEAASTKPAAAVLITDPDIERSSRNGIAPVAGEVSIQGGHIFDSGLHGVDFEPNTDNGAKSIVGIVDGVDIRRFNGLDVGGLTGYAVASASPITAPRSSILIERVTGDELRMAIWDTAVAIVRDNVSDRPARVEFPGSAAVTFTNNVRMTRR